MRTIAPYIEDQLKELPEKVLVGLYEIKKNKKAMPALTYLIDILSQGEMKHVFELKSGDENLANLHAYAKGTVRGMQDIEGAIEISGQLLDKTEEEK